MRMFLRWAERRGFEVEIDAASPGTEAGISSATFVVKGRYAYGYLRSEHGVHRHAGSGCRVPAVGAGADGGEGNRPRTQPGGDVERCGVAGCQQ